MIKELVHDPVFLALKSERAGIEDIQTARDLLDTLRAHSEGCVGMAANMIGVRKAIIAFLDDTLPPKRKGEAGYTVMLNPEIIKREGPYQTEEGCLSLLGDPRSCKRYKTVKVKYQTVDFQTRTKSFSGLTAQIIQHEIDHCEGVLI